MKIAVVGAGGMLGQMLSTVCSRSHETVRLVRNDLDIADLSAVRRRVAEISPEWILNAAAYTHVERAESEAEEAFRVNALGCRNLAIAARESGCRLLSFSTDYVFDGALERPYLEWDATNPINEYGRSKCVGERYLREHCPEHLIVRSSWLFGPGGVQFVDRILEKGHQEETLEVVDDQRGAPTYTLDLAQASLALVETERRGTYHVTNSEDCSWFEFTQHIFSLAGCAAAVKPVDSTRFRQTVRRPANSVLDNALMRLEGMSPLRSWREAVAGYLGSDA